MRELKKRNRLLEQENEILRRAAAYLARDINPKRSTRWSRILPPREFPWR
jgi:transposase-like protein